MQQYVIVAGAGISAAPPSNLPSWWEYNQKLISQIKKQALTLCPEAADILEHINVENKLPVQCISQVIVSQGAGNSYFPLLELLNGTIPNANHLALAELAWQGKLKAIVTTNFDSLIETAFRTKAVPLYVTVHKDEYYEASQINACRLFKIHGSVYDNTSMIDTISQKMLGLSTEKRFILENIFDTSEIFVIGFSGADLDFDLDYIPFSQALKQGSKLTWIIRPNSIPNPNVIQLQKQYPDSVQIREMELSDFFLSLGINIQDNQEIPQSGNVTKLDEKIEELFSSPHIGAHGCVGYCLTLLRMIGDTEGVDKLASIYEQKIDWSALPPLSVVGINALALQKMLSTDWEGAIRLFHTVIRCHLALDEISKSSQAHTTPEQRRSQQLETRKNLTSTYINLATTYYYMAVINHADTLSSAKKYLDLAQTQLQEEPNISSRSLITFGLARVEYQQTKDSNQYLDKLHVCRQFAHSERRLNTLVEIMLEECTIHMQIGEYPLARILLTDAQEILKNVGYTHLEDSWENLALEYELRTGVYKELVTDDVLSTLISYTDEIERKAIISYEAKKIKPEQIPPLFITLGYRYLSKKSWKRAWDLAQCCYMISYNDSQRVEALYILGCSDLELTNYTDAIHSFKQIVNMGKGINDAKLGWAHSELCRIFVRKHDVHQAIEHLEDCIDILQALQDMKQLTESAASCILELFRNNYSEQAEKVASRLLNIIDETNASSLQKYLEQLRLTYTPNQSENMDHQSPQSIATHALSLYDNGNTKKAWEYMELAQKKYTESDNLDGVGRCENNMAVWCLTEKQYKNAAQHFKKAMDIKFSLGDVGGAVAQLSSLLHLYISELDDLEEAKKLAHFAEQNMPLYANTQEKYLLHYTLFFYHLHAKDYATALVHGHLAEEGLPYLTSVNPGYSNTLKAAIRELEAAFSNKPLATDSDPFDTQILEAQRLGKIGKLEDCLALLKQLKKAWNTDPMRLGILDGTLANAYLSNGHNKKAINCFQSAICHFNEVTDGTKRIIANKLQLTAINGMAIAMSRLGNHSGAITLCRDALDEIKTPCQQYFTLTITFCNRLIEFHQNTLKKDDAIFTEVCNKLTSLLSYNSLDHETIGHVYCVYGVLYAVIKDEASAKQYYQQAKKEFLVINSPHLAKVEQALELLEQ